MSSGSGGEGAAAAGDAAHHTQRIGNGISEWISGASTPLRSLFACWAAPRPGVLVTAPDKIPTIVVMGIPVAKCNTMVITTLRKTESIATMFSVSPPFLKAEKNPGPTCRPME